MSNFNLQHSQLGEGARADAERDRGGEGEARVQDGVVPRAAEGSWHHALAGRQFNRHFEFWHETGLKTGTSSKTTSVLRHSNMAENL